MPRLIDEYVSQRKARLSGNIYHKTQIELAYNSNHIEGSRLSAEQTRHIFETKTLIGDALVDDVLEARNHFRLFDFMLETIDDSLDEDLIRQFHFLLKEGTESALSDSIYAPGIYKTIPNEVGGIVTATPEDVPELMRKLVSTVTDDMDFEDIVRFHHRFESIHPFQDGNGRVGRMIMFRQCLEYDVMPFIVQDYKKGYYYRGLHHYSDSPGWLEDTCRSFQDDYVENYLPLVPHIQISDLRGYCPPSSLTVDSQDAVVELDDDVDYGL